MQFLLTENIIYKTKLKEDEIIKRLSNLIKPEKSPEIGIFGGIWLHRYRGEISGQTFDIKRNMYTRENLFPRITGIIEHDIDGTTIKVNMRLNKVIRVFLWIWGTLFGLIFFVSTIQSCIDLELNIWTAISLILLLVIYAFALIGFKFESSRSIEDFALLFEADIVEA